MYVCVHVSVADAVCVLADGRGNAFCECIAPVLSVVYIYIDICCCMYVSQQVSEFWSKSIFSPGRISCKWVNDRGRSLTAVSPDPLTSRGQWSAILVSRRCSFVAYPRCQMHRRDQHLRDGMVWLSRICNRERIEIHISISILYSMIRNKVYRNLKKIYFKSTQRQINSNLMLTIRYFRQRQQLDNAYTRQATTNALKNLLPTFVFRQRVFLTLRNVKIHTYVVLRVQRKYI